MLCRDLDELYFSQLALAVYEKCALKFRYRYLDGLFWPRDWGGDDEQKELIETGRRFHLLAQRYYARGESLTEDLLSGDLKDWFNRLGEFRPYNQTDSFLPEHELRLNKNGLKLVAKYDLLYVDKESKSLVIYDWKTNKKPLSKGYRENFYQTAVYLYVLAEAGKRYFPGNKMRFADLSLIYWNPRFPDSREVIRYNEKEYQKQGSFLAEKIKEIKGLAYKDFQSTNDPKNCRYCEYRPICKGKKAELIEVEDDDLNFELDWERVDEIEF